MNDKKWREILKLETLSEFKKLTDNITENSESWLTWCNSEYVETCPLPKPYEKGITGFNRLLLISKLRPDRLLECARNYTTKHLKMCESATLEYAQITVTNGQPSKLVIFEIGQSINKEKFLSKLQSTCYPLVEPDIDSLQILVLHRQTIDCFKVQFKIACSKGQWLALLYFSESQDQIKLISRMLSELRDSDCHRRCRIFLMISNSCAPSAELLPLHCRINIAEPSSVRESIEKFYKILGEKFILLYSNDRSKWNLLALTLFHMSIQARAEIEPDAFVCIVTDEHWIHAEKALRENFTSDPSHLSIDTPHLINCVADIYLPSCSTDRSKKVVLHTIKSFLDAENIDNIPNRLPPLTHYSTPDGISMEEHIAQLEFIYKASNYSLSETSPYAVIQKQVSEGDYLKLSVRKVFGQESSSLDDPRQWMREMEDIIKLMHQCVPLQTSSYNMLIKDEINSFITQLKVIFTNLVCQNITCVQSCKLYKGIEIDLWNELNYTNEMVRLKIQALYLLEVAQCSNYRKTLVLKHFINPGAIWNSVVRLTFPKFDLGSLQEFVYVPHSERTKSGTSRWCLHLEQLTLLGASWDAVGERITQPDRPAMTTSEQTIALPVVPCNTKYGLKIQAENTGMCKIPVYRNNDLSTDPICNVFLSSSIPSVKCFLYNVRMIIY